MISLESQLWTAGTDLIAGIDEAGRGPLAGPVVAAAVIFPPYASIPGVRDSKTLTARQRDALYQKISQNAFSVGVGIIGSEEIDRINILKATLKAMKQAVDQLNITPLHLLVDGNQLPDCPMKMTAVVGGDRHCFCIAAASIIAKVTRDRLMVQYHRQFPVYGFDRHKGYGTRFHINAIRTHGYSPIHRRSFHVKELTD
jgi:ribonuclease HII